MLETVIVFNNLILEYLVIVHGEGTVFIVVCSLQLIVKLDETV